MLRDRTAHCAEGAFFAAAALRVHGHEPLIVDLEAVRGDDHLLAVFKERGHWEPGGRKDAARLYSRVMTLQAERRRLRMDRRLYDAGMFGAVKRNGAMMTQYQEIVSTESLAEALKSSEQQPVLFFKHSITCGISSRAFGEFQKYLGSPASAAVRNYVIVVQKARAASNALARLVEVRHESPQAIIVRNGRAVWSDSHLAIKSEKLAEAVNNAS